MRDADIAAEPSVPGILVVSELFPPAIGGSAVLFHEVYSRLAGPSVSVLTDTHASPGPGVETIGNLAITRRRIATRQWGLANPAGTWHHLRLARLMRGMRRRRDTIVHCGRALPEGIAAWIGHRLWGPRYICWSHGEDVTTALLSRELTFVMTRVYRAAGAVVANSENTRRLVIGLGVAADRVSVVYPGVDAERFHPGVDGDALRRTLAPDQETVLLSVGRLQRRKGHDLGIRAVAALASTGRPLRYVVVGDGEERPRLEALAIELGVADHVVFVGAVSAEALPRYYAACDVFLLPNRIEEGDVEGFGIVFLEAAASGKPAIGGSSGGVAEAVEDGVTGLLVGGTDMSELAEAIRRLGDAPSLRETLGRAGRRRVLARFTWDRAAGELAAIHARVAAEG